MDTFYPSARLAVVKGPTSSQEFSFPCIARTVVIGRPTAVTKNFSFKVETGNGEKTDPTMFRPNLYIKKLVSLR